MKNLDGVVVMPPFYPRLFVAGVVGGRLAMVGGLRLYGVLLRWLKGRRV